LAFGCARGEEVHPEVKAPALVGHEAPRIPFEAIVPSPVLDDGQDCKKPNAKPVRHEYTGLLRGVTCDDQVFLTMANVAGQLGATCEHCHKKVSDKENDYVAATPNKAIANWMFQHFMQSLRPKDGSRFACSSCHKGEDGKPLAKMLVTPRDPSHATEWMMLKIVNRFQSAKGEPLKCRSCHVGSFGKSDWHPKVLLETNQIPEHRTP
jgi:hypothetical protein